MDEKQAFFQLIIQLTQIKWILASICFIFLVGLIGLITMIYIGKKSIDKEEKDKPFKDMLSDLLDKDDLEGIIKEAKEKLKQYPKHLHAHWYLAQAYYRKKEYQNALNELNLISENAPSWKDQYLNPYIDEINKILKDHKSEAAKV